MKPASARTFSGTNRASQVVVFLGAQIRRQTVHGADEIGDLAEGGASCVLLPAAFQSFAHYIGPRNMALAGFGVDFSDQRIRKPHRERFHEVTVLRT